MTDGRPEPPREGGELETLTAFLDLARATLEFKCRGLTDEQLRERAVPPSGLSLLGLIRHLTDAERTWFANRFGRQDLPLLYCHEPDNMDDDFDALDSVSTAEAFAAWRAECERSREFVRSASLDFVGARRDGSPVSLRWLLVYMIDEYARHNGHADLLRERLDGSVGR